MGMGKLHDGVRTIWYEDLGDYSLGIETFTITVPSDTGPPSDLILSF